MECMEWVEICEFMLNVNKLLQYIYNDLYILCIREEIKIKLYNKSM